AGDVGDGVNGVIVGKLAADAIELCGGGKHFGITLARQIAFLDGGGVDANADSLGQDQRVSGLGVDVAAHLIGTAEADDGNAVDWLRRVDRVTAGNRNSSTGANSVATCDDRAHVFDCDLVERHAKYCERHDRFCAHSVNVGDRVGRGDPAEVEGVVHHRHE